MCGDSQDPIQLHPGANVYEIDFRVGGEPLNSGEKVGSTRSLSVLLSLVAVSGGSAVLSFAWTKYKVGSLLPVYHLVLHLLTKHVLSVFSALGHTNQERFVGVDIPGTIHHALGAGDELEGPPVTVDGLGI